MDYQETTGHHNVQTPRAQIREISNVHKLNMMFDQQEHITSKLFDEFLLMRCDKFYQDNKPSEDTMSSSVKETEVVRFDIVIGRIISFF